MYRTFYKTFIILTLSFGFCSATFAKEKKPVHRKKALKTKVFARKINDNKYPMEKPIFNPVPIKPIPIKPMPVTLPFKEINVEFEENWIYQQLFSGMVHSNYGIHFYQKFHNLVASFKDLYIDIFSNIETPEIDINQYIDYFDKTVQAVVYISKSQLSKAEETALSLEGSFKNELLSWIIDAHLRVDNVQKATELLSLMEINYDEEYEEYDEDNLEEVSEAKQLLVRYFVTHDQYSEAIQHADSMEEEYTRDESYLYIIAHLCKQSRFEEVLVLMDNVDDYDKEEAYLYMIDQYIKNDQIEKADILIGSLDTTESDSFYRISRLTRARDLFVMINNNELDEALVTIFDEDYRVEFFIYKVVEKYLENNDLIGAEEAVIKFVKMDEWGDIDEYNEILLYLANEHLKQNNFSDAKRIINEMDDFMDQALGSLLITMYSKN